LAQQRNERRKDRSLIHLANELVDLVFSETSVSSLVVSNLDISPSSFGSGEFEWPEELVGLLEVWSDCVNLMDEIFHADDSKL